LDEARTVAIEDVRTIIAAVYAASARFVSRERRMEWQAAVDQAIAALPAVRVEEAEWEEAPRDAGGK
jgi:hypothetical protein